MGRNASGIYIIDEDYNVVSYNHVAAKIYPGLKKGEKCYKCVMNNDRPCSECPVLNKIEGPKTYLDSVRKILASVDAVETELWNHKRGYAMVVSVVADSERLSDTIMGKNDDLRFLGVINVLGSDYCNIYSVNRKDRSVQIYRFRGHAMGVKEALDRNNDYETAVGAYIEQNVLSEDQGKLRQALAFENACQRLTGASQFTVHYRVKRDGEIHYFYVKCVRVGEAENFESIVFAFANEDSDVQRYEMEGLLEPEGTAGRRKVLVVEDNELNREILCELLKKDFDVLTAENGEEGLKLLSEYYRYISAVLLDVCMPVCDGFEFLERIKDDTLLSSIPVIVTTGSNKQEDEERCLELGAVDFVTKPYNGRIVIARLNSVIKFRESAAVLSAVEYDELTGLYTKQAFLHHAKTLIRYRSNQEISFIVADVRNFKWINSIYGEKTGDNVLVYIGQQLRKYIRGGLISRYGSDQYVCAVYGEHDSFFEDIDEKVKSISADAPVPNLVINYGIYCNIDKSLPVTLICDRAFLAMKSIQDDYERRVAFYDEEMSCKHIRDRMLENDFEAAVANNEFVAYFQPKYDVKTEKIAGAEALVRWIKPDGTMIFPGEFIPLYEKDGLIVKLDEYMFRQVCSIQKQRIEHGEKIIPISVNLSRASLHYRGMVEKYVEIVKDTGIPFSAVPIELTETAALYNTKIKELTEKLVQAGFQLHMDDFGSGYSSLTSLDMLPFNVLKLDKSLVDFINHDRGRQVIRHTIALAHGLGMKVLAEGVEEKEQKETLKKLDSDEIQGFYYSRPLPYSEFEKLYMEI